MLLHGYLDRVGAQGMFAAVTGGPARRYDDLAVLSTATLGFALGIDTVERAKHPRRAEAGAALGLGAVPELKTLRTRLRALADGSDPLELQRAFAARMVAVPGCSDRTIRRRLEIWAELGVTKDRMRTGLAGYDRMLGLDLDDLSVDGSITKSPCGGEVSGRSPVDRAKQGTKRSVVTDAAGLPLHLVAAAANAHDSPLPEPTLAGVPDAVGPLPDGACVHLDTGYDSGKTRDLLHIQGYDHQIATKGKPSPIQVGKRWVVERDAGLHPQGEGSKKVTGSRKDAPSWVRPSAPRARREVSLPRRRVSCSCCVRRQRQQQRPWQG